jgi:hypothetical protein
MLNLSSSTHLVLEACRQLDAMVRATTPVPASQVQLHVEHAAPLRARSNVVAAAG